jgi:hypothetical protein
LVTDQLKAQQPHYLILKSINKHWEVLVNFILSLLMLGKYIYKFSFVVITLLSIMSAPSEQMKQKENNDVPDGENVQETSTGENISGDLPTLNRKKRQLFDGSGRTNATMDGTEAEEFN